MRCNKTLPILRTLAKSTIRKSKTCRKRLKKSLERMLKLPKEKRRPIVIKLSTSMISMLITNKNWRLFYLPHKSD